MKLLVDFGATRIKAVVVNENVVVDKEEVISPSARHWECKPDHFQFDAIEFRNAWEKIIDQLIQRQNVDEIRVCTEMHGVIHNGTFYSWKDARKNPAEFNGNRFKEITGMQLRTGIPWITLQSIDLRGNITVQTIVDYCIGGNKIHLTQAHSLGLVDKSTNDWSEELVKAITPHLQLPTIITNIKESIGQYKGIPIFGGIGDLQSALFGVGLGENFDGVINLGTGSQVALIKTEENVGEYRPLVNGKATVVTHIPSGRALNIIARFVDSIKPNTFWEIWNSLTMEDVLCSRSGVVDLNMFPSAWRYRGINTGFMMMREDYTDVKDIIASTARSWIEQYESALLYMDHTEQSREIAVSGGLSKANWIIPTIKQLIPNRHFHRVNTVTGEETLDGLLKL